MQRVEIGEREKDVAANRLEATTGVAGSIPQNRSTHPVSNARLRPLEGGGSTSDPLAGDQPETRGSLLQNADQRGNERGIVLAIAVEGDDDRRAGCPHPAPQRRGLTRR